MASLAAAELRLPVLTVRWFTRSAPPPDWPWDAWHDERALAGEVRSDHPLEIWIAADLLLV